jgi:hypothetical protein
MNCKEAEPFLSAIYDGETTPREAVQHVSSCAECTSRLRVYSFMGLELRLAAKLEGDETPITAHLLNRTHSSKPSLLAFLFRQIAIPRLAFGAMVVALIVASAALSVIRAQTRPLWFGFGWDANREGLHISNIAQAGYKETFAELTLEKPVARQDGGPGKLISIAVHLAVTGISQDVVRLRVNARLYPVKGGQMSSRIIQQAERDLALGGQTVAYIPGETLEIPVEGGGTVYLRGYVQDHQPKIAWNFPLEPSQNELIVRSPILIRGDEVIGEFQASSRAGEKDEAVKLYAGSNGTYTFALTAFTGAVKGKANWGQLTFKMDGKNYRLVAAAPLTGGDQPHSVWVRFDPATLNAIHGLGSGKLSR